MKPFGNDKPHPCAALTIARVMAAASVYEVLGVSSDLAEGTGLSKKKIKDNFMRMARSIHPDRCSEPDAPLAFSRLRAAYEEVTADLDNPRPTVTETSPRAELPKRRHAAVVTSRLLRGALQMDGPVENSYTRGAFPGQKVSGTRASRSAYKTRRSDGHARTTQAPNEGVSLRVALQDMDISSASAPSDLLAELSPHLSMASPQQDVCKFNSPYMLEPGRVGFDSNCVSEASAAADMTGSLADISVSQSWPHSPSPMDRQLPAVSICPADLSII